MTTILMCLQQVKICDGIDNDCDLLIDATDMVPSELTTYYIDEDGDGHGFGQPFFDCEIPPNGTLSNNDCDDENPNISPDQEEVCDGRDNNCDGLIDDEDPNISISTYYLDEDGGWLWR